MSTIQPVGVVPSRLRWPRDIGVGDAAAAVVLSVAVVVLVHIRLDSHDPHAGLAGGLLAVTMTLPVLFARRAPMAAAAVVAVAAVVNGVAVGHYIRCGAALPAEFWIACVIGLRLRGRAALAGMLLVLAGLQAQGIWDSQLDAASIVGIGPIAIAFWLVGRVLAGRAATLRRTAESNREIAATREQTARLAVAGDRERIAGGLAEDLRERLAVIATRASNGRERAGDPVAAHDALAGIAGDGRAALTHLREVVGTLRDDAPLQPPPDLRRLGDLIAHGGGRLEVAGTVGAVPAGIELAGYRVVEQLLRTFTGPGVGDADGVDAVRDGDHEPVLVRLTFAADALELRITGRAESPESAGPPVALARQRLRENGGSLQARQLAGRLEWVARLPLAAATS